MSSTSVVARNSMVAVLTLLLAVVSVGRLCAAECPYLYGIHDHDPQPTEYLNHIKNVLPGGWVTATVAIGHNPNDTGGVDFSWFANQGHTVVCRLNNGYCSDGTIPLPAYYADFAQRCAKFVQNSSGCEIWVIGNETNLAGEWPPSGGHKAYVSPTDYANCFRQVYNAIKAVRPTHKVLCQALAPWGGPYGSGTVCGFTHDGNPLSWVDYMNQMLTAIKNSGGIDGIALHINSRGYTYADIHSPAQVSVGGKNLYWSFYVYKDWVNYGIPSDLYNLPLYATECNGMFYWKGGHPEDTSKHYEAGWMQEIYKEIDSYNRTVAVPQGKPVFRCINMYRWCAWCDGWNIDGSSNPYKGQILSDLDGALAFKYTWPESSGRPAAWSDDFNDGVLDQNAPEPDWTPYLTSGGVAQETGGYLKLTGASGSQSYALVRNSEYMLYDNFIIRTKLYLANTGATVSGEANAEIRFRVNSSGVGYSLSFKAQDSPNAINLRRSDTWAIIQSKQVTYNLPSGTTLYARIECNGTRIKIQVGATEGGSNVVNWDFTDSTFTSKGCFWLMNYHMLDARFDYFSYEPLPTGIKGVVRDSLGNPVGGASIATSTGGYSATSNPDGTYSITGMTPATYSATASKTNYTSHTVNNISVTECNMTAVDFTLTDSTPPTTPVVTDDGAYQTSANSLHFSWASSDPESGVSEYKYAISATTLSANIIPGGDWLSTGTATQHTRTGLSLTNGQIYYGLVRAWNPLNAASGIGASDGIRVAKGVSSIAFAKAEPDGTMVALEDRIVAAGFSDCIYIEDPDKTSGIKVAATGIGERAVVDLAGYLSTVNGERQVSAYSISAPSSTDVPDPLALVNAALGGGSLNAYTPGITNGVGVHNIGLLVATWGKVLQSEGGWFVISDGSTAGLKVKVPSGVDAPPAPKYVIVTGISSVESSGGTVTRLLRARKQADIRIMQ